MSTTINVTRSQIVRQYQTWEDVEVPDVIFRLIKTGNLSDEAIDAILEPYLDYDNLASRGHVPVDSRDLAIKVTHR